MKTPDDRIFRDANAKPVKYNHSPLSWRVSAYSVIIQNQQVLLIKSKDKKFYDLPGGGVEFGESVEAALKREALEEAGATVAPGNLISHFQDNFYHRREKKFYQTLLLFFNAKLTRPLQKPTDNRITFAQFVRLSQLSDYLLLDYVEKVIVKTTK